VGGPKTELFLELGLDLVVDLPAPAPERHLRALDPLELTQMKSDRADRNRRIIEGDPVELFSRLLRGRASLRPRELRLVIDKWIPIRDRDRCWARIAASHANRCLGDPSTNDPIHLTTADLHTDLEKVEKVIWQAARNPLDGAYWRRSVLSVVRGVDYQAVLKALHDLIDDANIDFDRERIEQIVLLDLQLSTIDTLWPDQGLPIKNVWLLAPKPFSRLAGRMEALPSFLVVSRWTIARS
jgi:hypothetical protein